MKVSPVSRLVRWFPGKRDEWKVGVTLPGERIKKNKIIMSLKHSRDGNCQ